MNSNSFSILFWVLTRRIKNGVAPIYCRITLNGERVEINTSKFIDPDFWDNKAQKATGKTDTIKDINFHLDSIKGSLNKHFSLLVASDKPISAEILKQQYMGFKPKEKNVLETYDYYLKKFKEKVSVGKRDAKTLTRLTISKQN